MGMQRWGLRCGDKDGSYTGRSQLMTPTALVLLEPAGQHIGVHSVLPGQSRDRGSRLLARRHQLCLELRLLSPMGASNRMFGNL